MHLGNAIKAHQEWKVKFRSAIDTQEILDTVTISAENCCELGQWLYGEAKTLFGKLPSHTHCVATHRIFHREAGTIAAAINAKSFAEAAGLLDLRSQFSEASTALTAAILQLKKDALDAPGVISLIAKLSE